VGSRSNARADWEARAGRRTAETAGDAGSRVLPPPARVSVEEGAGHVTVRWRPVPGAMGYLVHKAPGPDGPWEPIDHAGRDLLPVPGPYYCDTTGEPGEPAWYAVATIVSMEDPPGELSDAVEATPRTESAAPLSAVVRADRDGGRLGQVWHLLGSEHASQLLCDEETGGHPIGEDFAEALRMARAELGAERVRAHAILHDELRVYREEDGAPVYDFSRIERVYDRLLETGLYPVVEVSFMPRDLARDPDETVFEYGGIISPPHDWDRWAELNAQLARHLVDRYGIDEVARWGFEIWNEANLEVFWSGTQDEYFRLYETAARAIKDVDERLLVGGPSSAAAGWIVDFLDFVVDSHAPLDFVTTHSYGNLPLDVREPLRVRGLDDVEIWWTEWGASPTHNNELSDLVWGAPYVLHGMRSVQGRVEGLAYWVVSDHFEELGRPTGLIHGGFGLLTVGNLRKPRWWALVLAEQLGTDLVELELSGDGAGVLVDGWAARKPDGSVDVLLWNGTLNQRQASGDPLLGREVRLRVEGLEGGRYAASLARIDDGHSNLLRDWPRDRDWPSAEEWDDLRGRDRLDEEDLGVLEARGGAIATTIGLPMPGVARLRLAPA
jgi:xylan 1,4-beta-xylosidase